ncbi:MAG: hypothetical protein ABS75_09925 [Pelagibacterium sp. SCN 63-23]|nr:MAG: hypothetical protein ABS75_09925 [Pelagibacterium sp. SCN 63-23]
MPAARVNPADTAFIHRHLVPTSLSFRHDILLYRPTPQSGLTRFLAERGRADRPPYWAYAWAGGAALSLHLQAHPGLVTDRVVVDFGAGSGLVGIAAARAGAGKVWAIDPDPIAHAALTLNAEANGVAIELWEGPDLPRVDLILAGDVFYDADVAAHALPILAAAAAPVLIGDPFRHDLPLAKLDQIAEYEVPDMGGDPPVRAGIFALHGANIGNVP